MRITRHCDVPMFPWQPSGKGKQLACILSVIAAVAVAIPLMRCMKFNAKRSATKMDRALPLTVPKVVPDLTWSPSFPVHCTDKQGSTVEKTCTQTQHFCNNSDSQREAQDQRVCTKKRGAPTRLWRFKAVRGSQRASFAEIVICCLPGLLLLTLL